MLSPCCPRRDYANDRRQLLDKDREKENEIVVSAVRYLFERGLLNVSEAADVK